MPDKVLFLSTIKLLLNHSVHKYKSLINNVLFCLEVNYYYRTTMEHVLCVKKDSNYCENILQILKP